jgi:hypothetical protein
MGAVRRCAGLAALALALGLPWPVAAEPLAVIVSGGWEEVSAIELRDLRAIYLGDRTRLHGRRVRRIDLPSGSAAREGFSRSVLGRPESELERYWIEQALSGGALPPRQLATPEEVIATVAGRVGTLGYVPVSALELPEAEGVRSLRVIVDGVGLPPSHADYPARSRA